MKICDAKIEDVLNIDPSLSVFDVEDILTLGNPNDTIEETILKFHEVPRGECCAI